MTGVLDVVKPGVVTGDGVQKLLQFAKDNSFAMPAVNVVGTNSVNAVLEAAASVNSPVMIQFSNGGAGFLCGQGVSHRTRHWSWARFRVPIMSGQWLSCTVFR